MYGRRRVGSIKSKVFYDEKTRRGAGGEARWFVPVEWPWARARRARARKVSVSLVVKGISERRRGGQARDGGTRFSDRCKSFGA